MDEWIKKMWYVHTMEYYSALKRQEILPYAIAGMNLEDTVLKILRGLISCCLLLFFFLFSHSVLSNSLQLYGLQYTMLLCPSLSPGVC